MERRNYATILLFVLGIIEIYSFPQKREPEDKGIILYGNPFEHKVDENANVPVALDRGGGTKRIKRKSHQLSPEQAKKEEQMEILRARAVEKDLRTEIIRRVIEKQHATREQINAIVESYMRDGYGRFAAIGKFQAEHPTLANIYFPPNRYGTHL